MRGNIRDRSKGSDIVFTGPRMKVVYSGCNWNTVVFTMDSSQAEFDNWLHEVWDKFQELIRQDPLKYKVMGRNGPMFSMGPVTQSKDPELYPNELRCRLSTRDQISTAVLLHATTKEKLEPNQIWGGGYMTPVLKLGYYKEGDEFGLSLTVLKADYEPTPYVGIQNEEWMIDGNTVGSPSSLSAPLPRSL